MSYLLEQLGADRFQELCQALLAKAFPTTQCFPVAQPDGGRDAVAFHVSDETGDGFIVFQVKFVKKPEAEKDPHKWLLGVMKDELPKLQKLIPKGANAYYLLTNVQGTSHTQSGSVDVLQQLLDGSLEVQGRCWWRDDINRRLDDAWAIKWSYPEILRGTDLLYSILEAGLAQDAQRRTSTIRAFVRDQHERDTQVKFKQIELQNKLLDLFIDVPVNLRETVTQKRAEAKEQNVPRWIAQQLSMAASDSRPYQREDLTLGSATFLLHPLAQTHLKRVVLEGAPGQGKSTVVQYLCQIHRMRILGESINDDRILPLHRIAPVKIPFKIDCRDFALWLSRQNPFTPDNSIDVPECWQKSLESFLATHVTHYSGGSDFSVADLHAVARLSSILLVFDGLDEVADITRRREVIDEIAKGVSRLNEIAISVQTVVTSRPAAFADSPGFPEDTYSYFQLASITHRLIENYAEKWLRARKLVGKEASDVRRILKDKLDQPHLRELARNPMQLAILLSLIQTRGGSLPDKRTALYDSYVELFFNRESEKSAIVRDNRDLLVDIHRHLAWVLHSEAQTKKNRGSISSEDLQRLVREYLQNEGYDQTLAGLLFTGMVERVVALVSRVEGTYEFEVQPLREYFAARHLYNTAPYSPPGNEKRGTLPERFDALARDFFWQNVTRFYAGCYSKGELPSLVECLEDLARSDGYRHTNHPQQLAATLLSDWVFAQHPKLMKKVVALLLDRGLGLRRITSGGLRRGRQDPLMLPKNSGNDELVSQCFEHLRARPSSDYSSMLIELIAANATREEAANRWLTETLGSRGSERTRWIRYGLQLGTLSHIDKRDCNTLLQEGVDTAERLELILRSGQNEPIEENEEWFSLVANRALDGDPTDFFSRGQSILE